jgi:hypothetical protein
MKTIHVNSVEEFFKCRNLTFHSKQNADFYLRLNELLFKHVEEGKSWEIVVIT